MATGFGTPTKGLESQSTASERVAEKVISHEVVSAEFVAPRPVPVVVATRPTYPVGCENYRSLVSQYRWNVDVALAVMKAESGCNPTRHNWGDRHRTCLGSFGLFQVGCVHGYTVAYLENPAQNIAAAWKIYQGSGWKAWGVCTSGKVRCY